MMHWWCNTRRVSLVFSILAQTILAVRFTQINKKEWLCRQADVNVNTSYEHKQRISNHNVGKSMDRKTRFSSNSEPTVGSVLLQRHEVRSKDVGSSPQRGGEQRRALVLPRGSRPRAVKNLQPDNLPRSLLTPPPTPPAHRNRDFTCKEKHRNIIHVKINNRRGGGGGGGIKVFI